MKDGVLEGESDTPDQCEEPTRIKVLAWGTYDTGKPRTRILLQGLREAGVSVAECHVDLWHGIEDKSQIVGVWRWLWTLMRWIAAYPVLIVRYMRHPAHDVVLVGYWGQFDVLVIWPFARMRGAKIVWDPLLSLYNTLVEHRNWLSEIGLAARAIWLLEWLGCRAADLIVTNTERGAAYFDRTFHLPEGRTSHVFLGAETDVFAHRGPFGPPPLPGQRLRVLFLARSFLRTALKPSSRPRAYHARLQSIGYLSDRGRRRHASAPNWRHNRSPICSG